MQAGCQSAAFVCNGIATRVGIVENGACMSGNPSRVRSDTCSFASASAWPNISRDVMRRPATLHQPAPALTPQIVKMKIDPLQLRPVTGDSLSAASPLWA